MNIKCDKLTQSMPQSVTRRSKLKKSGNGLAGVALACLGLANALQAQTSLVCDPAGDTTYSGAKGGPKIPAWLDIVQSEITDAGSDIHFTLTPQPPFRRPRLGTPSTMAANSGGAGGSWMTWPPTSWLRMAASKRPAA